MPFIDTHAHLHFPEYNEDRKEVMGRATAAGVKTFINVGTDVASSKECLRLAHEFPNIYATAGIHPNDSAAADENAVVEIAQLLRDPKVVAIGEVGLDFYRDHSPRQKQQDVFRSFLQFHKATQKPLVIHCRDAYEEMLALLSGEGKRFSGVMHCFSSDAATMKRFLDFGFHISFAGPLTYKKNDALREACAQCPVDRLLLETDSPFLPPQTMRGKRNEPAFMIETAEVAAGLHNLTLEQLGEKTTANAKKVFGC